MTQFYNQNPSSYFETTVNADMSKVIARFLAYLPKGSHILDAGCGSGRDTKTFLSMNYQVTAFDASKPLCTLASTYTGIKVANTTFIEFTSDNSFDGIWACASLLHVPRDQLTKTLSHLSQYLKPNGYFYCSFKLGNEETESDNRLFNNQNETSILKYITENMEVVDIWTSDDNTKILRQQKWLNIILRLI